MKLFIVELAYFEGAEVVAVFDSLNKAKDFMSSHPITRHKRDTYVVHEAELNQEINTDLSHSYPEYTTCV